METYMPMSEGDKKKKNTEQNKKPKNKEAKMHHFNQSTAEEELILNARTREALILGVTFEWELNQE